MVYLLLSSFFLLVAAGVLSSYRKRQSRQPGRAIRGDGSSQARAPDRRGLEVRQAAESISRAFESYREGRISKEGLRARQDQFGDLLVIATRSCVLDDKSCEACLKFDGLEVLVGSDEYLKYSPPNGCMGGCDECRCVWMYTAVNSTESGLGERLGAILEGGVVFDTMPLEEKMLI